jgi:hypothetical protein
MCNRRLHFIQNSARYGNDGAGEAALNPRPTMAPVPGRGETIGEINTLFD